jgi:hypothetical protein
MDMTEAKNFTEDDLNALRKSLTSGDSEVTPTDASTLGEMNTISEEICALRDEEKRLADLKSEITKRLEAKENRVTEILLENGLNSYKAPTATMSLSFRTSVRQPQGENVILWIESLKKEYESLEGAIQAGMLSTNSMKLNSWYKEKIELAKEQGQEDFQIPGLTEVKINPTLSFRRAR